MFVFWVFMSCSFHTTDAIDLKNANLTEVPRDISNDTTHVYLSYNNISIIRDDALSYLPSLHRLDVSRNRIKTIEDHAFRSTKLVELIIHYNKLKLFPNLSDIGETVKTVYFNGNPLKFLRNKQIEHLAALEHLYISNTKITELDFVSTGYLAPESLE
ncbi:hypothetical protein CAPTEDRAFT_186112 [Capitella teleta]|uniref:LRRNT domain-containing protein n=1 Tax=Capitella teleta TaxID=283909 RepID=R7U9Y9_CAPTE|nr:hypothetical protein CAPTEDRAFT_186112 [Capitella teleta]|eukprot:ELT99940.1 hypothetical protein CAPTEDRAFT_186112 [Capitella teleta]